MTDRDTHPMHLEQPAPATAPIATTSPHGSGNRVARFVWGLVYTLLFRPSPRIMHRWRNRLLRIFGASLHRTSRVYPTARIWAPWNLTMAEHACLGDNVDCYCVAPITIGASTIVSQYGYLCAATHDHEDPRHPLIPMSITIGARCWLAADVFVGPGVSIADGTVVGARSSVFSDLPEWVVAMGTPAKPVGKREFRPGPTG